MSDSLPLSAQLSQLLVAFTIEFDLEYELRMRRIGHPGFVSLAAWRNVLRYVGRRGITLRELSELVPIRPGIDTRFTLGALERWGFLNIEPPERRPEQRVVREGYGSSRGFGSDWRIVPTPRTVRALEIWPTVLRDIDARWESRFGRSRVEELRASLLAIVESFDTMPPEGLPDRAARPWAVGALLGPDDDWSAAPRPDDEPSAIPVLLARTLWSFAVMFDREAPVPLAIGANLLRALDADGIPVRDLPSRTGNNPSGLSAIVLKSGLLEVVAKPGGARGRVVRLTSSGLAAKDAYERLVPLIERRWAKQHGQKCVERLRQAVNSVRNDDDFGRGLRPEPGLPRAGTYTAGFDVGPPGVMLKRARAMLAQTRAFTTDPRGTLPHYPVWDGNAGFGP